MISLSLADLRRLGFEVQGGQAVPVPRSDGVASRREQTVKAFLDCPIRSEANLTGKLRGYLRRKTEQKEAVIAVLGKRIANRGVPKRVTFVLLSSQPMDDDNLARAFKAIRDQIAELCGFNDVERVWHYEQRKPFDYECRGFWVKIEFQKHGE